MNFNIVEILEAVSMIVAGATILARLTPTKEDDTFLEKVRKFLEKIGNLFLPDRT